VHATYLPNKVIAGSAGDADTSALPLLRGKRMIEGKPTAYVCVKYLCKKPVQDPAALAAQLAGE
jgi:uncharacterized protein YyaL (SSP411 family)